MDELNQSLLKTPDLNAERLAELKRLFPDLFTVEGRLDPNELRKLVEPEQAKEQERYEFNWFGKANAKRNAFAPTNTTLVFDRDRSVNPENSDNIIIEGENLEVLKLLLCGYRERIKCVYIDPPYNTGSDRVYSDNYTQEVRPYWDKVGALEAGVKVDTNPDTNGRFHSDWLDMIYSRLFVAFALLKHDGFIFISIGDEEIHNLRKVCDEVFGPENYRNTLITRRYDKNVNRQFIETGLATLNVGYENILVYSKSPESRLNPVYRESSEKRQNFGYWKGFWNDANRITMRYEVLGVKPETGQWKWGKHRGLKAVKNYEDFVASYAENMTLEEYWEETGKKLDFVRRNPAGKGKNRGVEHWVAPATGILRNTNWTDLLASKSTPEIDDLFDSPKNIEVIEQLVRSCEDNGDIILDFFGGSGSTAQALLEMNHADGRNRRFILAQLPELIDGSTETGKRAIDAGFTTVSQLTIERTKRVCNKLNGGMVGSFGFKVFRLEKSNFPRTEFKPDDSKTDEENYAALQDYIREKEAQQAFAFNLHDLLTEILIKQGFNLNFTYTLREEFEQNEVFHASDSEKQTLICLDADIKAETIGELGKVPDEKFICLERALDTTKKWNLNKLLGERFKAI